MVANAAEVFGLARNVLGIICNTTKTLIKYLVCVHTVNSPEVHSSSESDPPNTKTETIETTSHPNLNLYKYTMIKILFQYL